MVSINQNYTALIALIFSVFLVSVCHVDNDETNFTVFTLFVDCAQAKNWSDCVFLGSYVVRFIPGRVLTLPLLLFLLLPIQYNNLQ